MLTQERLRELVHYDPETGIFTAKVARDRVRVGDRLGTPRPSGYLYCMICRKNYALHRLAWFYMTGCWPPQVDHRNWKKADNRWRNLRDATGGQNTIHCVLPANGIGFRGVQARLLKSGKIRYRAILARTHIGVFDTPEEAYAAYVAAARATYGEFAEHL